MQIIIGGTLLVYNIFIIPKIILGLLIVIAGIAIVGCAFYLGNIVFKRRNEMRKTQSQLERKTKKPIENYNAKIRYAKDRVDAIQRVKINKKKVVYMDQYVPLTKERLAAVPFSFELASQYEVYQQKEKEFQTENNSERRKQLKMELIHLSFVLQDLATKNTISATSYDDMEMLYKNKSVLNAYKKLEKEENNRQHELKMH